MEAIETKVVILGSSNVGKTSIVEQFIYSRFSERTQATIGGAFIKKTLNVNSREVTLQVWDTAGQERFRSLAPMYYRGAHAAILVFDVTTPESIRQTARWAQELSQHANDDIIMVVAANKIDLREQTLEKSMPVVDNKEANEFATSVKASLFQTSAKTGAGITELFQHVASELLKADTQKKLDGGRKKRVNETLLEPPPQQERCC